MSIFKIVNKKRSEYSLGDALSALTRILDEEGIRSEKNNINLNGRLKQKATMMPDFFTPQLTCTSVMWYVMLRCESNEIGWDLAVHVHTFIEKNSQPTLLYQAFVSCLE